MSELQEEHRQVLALRKQRAWAEVDFDEWPADVLDEGDFSMASVAISYAIDELIQGKVLRPGVKDEALWGKEVWLRAGERMPSVLRPYVQASLALLDKLLVS